MPLVMQAKLLRVLEERQVERVGGDRPIAGGRAGGGGDAPQSRRAGEEGRFRQDLYHRIYVFPLVLPPLRERADDIPALVAHFASQVAEQNGWKAKPFEPGRDRGAAAIFLAGQRARAAQRGGAAAAAGRRSGGCGRGAGWRCRSPRAALRRARAARSSGPLAQRTDAFEREQILAELKRHNQRMTETAKALGLERSHLYKKCQALGIDLRAMRSPASKRTA